MISYFLPHFNDLKNNSIIILVGFFYYALQVFGVYDIIAQINMKSTYYLAKCYEYGQGCEINKNLAFKLLKIVAGEGDSDALYDLGVCYLYGIGVEKNEKVRCFKPHCRGWCSSCC